MSDFDYAREAALKLALQHHVNMADTAEDVVKTANTFLDFLTVRTVSDREFREGIKHLAESARPLD